MSLVVNTMSYKDIIPSRGFIVKPYSREFYDFKGFLNLGILNVFGKYPNYSITNISPFLVIPWSETITYNKGTVVGFNDSVYVYRATMDVPKNKGREAKAPDGLPYWVIDSIINKYAPFDGAKHTKYKIVDYGMGIIKNDLKQGEVISILGIDGKGEKVAYVDFTIRNEDHTILRTEHLSIDLTYRDRIMITMPIWLANWSTISQAEVKIILQSSIKADLTVGAIITGKAQTLGASLVGFSTGLTTTRKTEPNYLARNVVEKSYETLKMQFLCNSPEEYMRIKYLLRQASATSHIIHGGLKNYDQEFIFGVVDGSAPLDHRTINKATINGVGVSFLETDPLKTEKSNEGWG